MLDIVPTVEFPPEMPFTLHVTAVFDVPVTVAVNCCVFPSNTLELEDDTITVTDWSGGLDDWDGGLDELLPPQPTRKTRRASEQRRATTARNKRNKKTRVLFMLFSCVSVHGLRCQADAIQPE